MKDAALYGAGDMTGKLIAFLTFPIIASYLTPHDFGMLDLIMTTVGLLSLCLGCGLNNAVQRFYWEHVQNGGFGATVVSSGLYVQTILTALFLICAVIFFFPGMEIAEKNNLTVGYAAIISAIILVPATQWVQYAQDITRLRLYPYKFLFLSLFVRVGIALLALLVVVKFSGGVDAYLIVMAAVTLLAVPIGLWLIRDDLTLKFDKVWSKDLFLFGYPFIFVIIAHWLLGSIDRWMLAYMVSVSEAGIYGVAFRFSALVLFVANAFGLAWSPHSMKIRADHPEKYPQLCGVILLFLLYFMLIVGGGCALFSGEIIGALVPAEYEGAAVALAILCFAIVIQSTMQVSAVGISLAKKTHLFIYMAWFATAINFILNLILMPKLGATAAAISTLVCYVFITSMYMFFTQRLMPIHVPWLRLGWLCFLGLIIAALSLNMIAYELDAAVILIKIFAGLVCAALGAIVLPIKEIKELSAIK